jgi:sulfate-transporting ATPase
MPAQSRDFAMAQYVFTMNRVGKIVPPKRQILKNISLSFFPGAKIGVLGLNGSGKSTLLKIMAGVDKDIEGEAVPMPGLKIGYLEQEPKLDPDQTVREAVEEGIGGVLAAKKRLDEVYAAYAEEDADFDALAAEQGELEAIICRRRQREHRPAAGTGRRRAACRRGTPSSACCPAAKSAAWRCAACCSVQARHAAARRTHQPLGRRIGRLAGAVPAALPRHRGGHHPRSLLPGQRGRVDSRTRPRPGIPWKGNYSDWLDQKEARLETGAEVRRRPHEGDEGGTEVGALQCQGPPGQEQGAPGPLRGTERRRLPEAQRDQRNLHPRGRAPGQ